MLSLKFLDSDSDDDQSSPPNEFETLDHLLLEQPSPADIIYSQNHDTLGTPIT